MNVDAVPRIVAAMGAPGSGKSHFVKDELHRLQPQRLLIVDPEDEYSIGSKCGSLRELVLLTAAPEWRVRFVPSIDRGAGVRDFNFACALAFVRAPCVFVVDELHEFVTASEAPTAWRRLVKRGRKHGVTIFAAAQRPASIDKGLWSNASLIRCGRLNYAEDQRVMAAALDVPVDRVAALVEWQCIARDRVSGALTGAIAGRGAAERSDRASERAGESCQVEKTPSRARARVPGRLKTASSAKPSR
jgi:hypothetical protein